VALPIFFAIDMVWLGAIAQKLYQKHLGYLMAPQVNWLAALLFYLLFIGGVVAFVVQPALTKQSLLSAILMGMLFGLVTYATYDLTNLATIKSWPILITVIDLLWGMTLSGSVAGLSYFLITKFHL
jgi:uncharacterized membrane protein